MKAVVLDGYTLNPGDLDWKDLQAHLELVVYDRTQPHEVISRISDASIVFTNKTVIDKEVIESCDNVKYIGVLATGYNVVDIEECQKRGIIVTNVPTYSTQAVAQHVLALLLEVTNQVGLHNQLVKQKVWSQGPDFTFWSSPLIELYGKTAGIIGYGKIGQAVTKVFESLGMNVIVYNRSQIKDDYPQVPLEYLLQNSDVISLHVPLTKQTHQIINEDRLKLMKKEAILINTSRGPLIDEEVLVEALSNQWIYAAALDVTTLEPIQSDHPLLALDNCFITPHIAWAPTETRRRLLGQVVDNVVSYLNGQPINVVTK